MEETSTGQGTCPEGCTQGFITRETHGATDGDLANPFCIECDYSVDEPECKVQCEECL